MADIIKQQDTRREFIDSLIELADTDARIVLIVPDVGFNYIEEFSRLFPDRFYNFGVTEQSTMTIAAGMALSGLKPYVYSMINFVIFRSYEAVRNAVCLHNADVKIIGVKGSEKYKFLGFSHNLIEEQEEIKALSQLHNLQCHIVNKPDEVRNIIIDTYNISTPCYIRL